jgi:hypothetical protein
MPGGHRSGVRRVGGTHVASAVPGATIGILLFCLRQAVHGKPEATERAGGVGGALRGRYLTDFGASSHLQEGLIL